MAVATLVEAVDVTVVAEPELAEPDADPEAETAAKTEISMTGIRHEEITFRRTLTELGAERDRFFLVRLVADGRATVANAIAKVGVVAETLDVVARAAKLTGLAQHVGDASLLYTPISQQGSPRIRPSSGLT